MRGSVVATDWHASGGCACCGPCVHPRLWLAPEALAVDSGRPRRLLGGEVTRLVLAARSPVCGHTMIATLRLVVLAHKNMNNSQCTSAVWLSTQLPTMRIVKHVLTTKCVHAHEINVASRDDPWHKLSALRIAASAMVGPVQSVNCPLEHA